MSKESPFFLTKIECPICKTLNEFETLKVGAYVEEGRDTDFCPLETKWRYPRYQAINPLAFFTVTCNNCYYTREFSNNFKEWKNDNHFRTYRLKTVKEKHLDKLAVSESVLKKMGQAVDIVRHPNESAIIKLHLSILDELLPDRPSMLDLGRFYLRIGWVFRSMQDAVNPNDLFINGLMMEMCTKFTALQNCHSDTGKESSGLINHINSHFDNENISTDIQSQMIPFKDKFGKAVENLQTQLESAKNEFEKINEIIIEYKNVVFGGSQGSGGSFGNHASFKDFLFDVKKDWSLIVVNESEALEKAIHYYIQALEDGRTISAGNQLIQASYLIAELSRRIGDFDNARQYFNSTIKHGQEFVYQNRQDPARTALARKILELAIEQGKLNLEASKNINI